MISRSATNFILAENCTEEKVSSLVRALGEFTGADRISVLNLSIDPVLDDGTIVITSSWENSDFMIQKAQLTLINDIISQSANYSTALLNRQVLLVLASETDSPGMQHDLSKANIKSLLFIPMRSDNEAIGYLAFAHQHQEFKLAKTDADLLLVAASILGAGIRKLQNRQKHLETGGDFTASVEYTDIGIWEWDLLRQRIHYSGSLGKMFGRSDDDGFLGPEEWTGLVHPDDVEYLKKELEDYFTGISKQFRVTYRARCVDGSFKEVLSQGKIVTYTPEGIPARFVGTHVDVTEEYRKLKWISKNEARLETLLRALPDNIFIISDQGVIEECYANDPGNLTLPKEQLLNQKLQLPDPVNNEGLNAIHRALSSNSVVIHKYALTISGQDRYFEARISPISKNKVISIVRDETTKTVLDQELNESKKQLEKSQKIARVGSWERDLIKNQISWSSEVYELLGIDWKETPSYPLLRDRIHPDDHNEFIEQMEDAVQTGKPFFHVFRFVMTDGTIKYIEARGETITVDNVPVKVIGTAHDITELKIAELALEENERRYRITIDESPIAVIMTNDLQFLIRVNPAAKRLCGFSDAELMQMKFSDLVHPSSFFPLERHMEQVKNAGSNETELKIICNDGKVADIKVITTMLSNRDLVSFCEDITEKKKMIDQLNENEKRFKNFFEAMDDMVYFFDIKSKKVVFANSFPQNLGGVHEYYATDDSAYWLNWVYEHDTTKVQNAYAKVLNDKSNALTYRILDKNGKIRWLWDRHWVIFDTRQNPVRIEGICSDITESKEHENLIQNALIKEQELNELKSRFISTTSHEFRTPLTSILSSTELLETYGNKWDDKKKSLYYQKIKTTISNMKNLLEQVILINKAESGKIECKAKFHHLKEFCTGIFEEFTLNGLTNIHLRLAFNAPNKNYLFDELLMAQVLRNLLSNAVKYSPDGGNILLSVDKRQDHLIFTIQDEGIGIPAGEVEHIFDPFFRGENTNDIEGTGLGMAIVKNAVDAHHGTINCISLQGKGTTIIVVIPAESEKPVKRKTNI